MKSIEFLEELKDLKNFKNIEIGSIHLDSRDVQKDGIFFAYKGNEIYMTTAGVPVFVLAQCPPLPC